MSKVLLVIKSLYGADWFFLSACRPKIAEDLYSIIEKESWSVMINLNKDIRCRMAAPLFMTAVFVFCFLFFTKLYPVPVMDMDDMLYINHFRVAIPIPFFWNPSRVMPELLMPLSGSLAGVMTAAGLGSFIDCQVFTTALFLSFFITLYVYEFFRLCESFGGRAKQYRALCLSLLFLVLHFTVFRTEYSDNYYLFWAPNACITFFYIMSALLNCSMVMFLLRQSRDRRLDLFSSPARGSVVIVALYLAIFSNLYQSVLIASYCGVELLIRLITAIRRRETLSEIIKGSDNTLLYAAIVLLWLLSAMLEAFGGRAASFQNDTSYVSRLIGSFRCCFSLMKSANILVAALFFASLAAAGAVFAAEKDREERRVFLSRLGLCAAFGLVTFVGVNIFTAATTYSNSALPHLCLIIYFCLFLLMSMCIDYIVRRVNFTAALLPLVIIVLFSYTNTEGRTFKSSMMANFDSRDIQAFQNEICEKIIRAVEDGEDEVTLELILLPDDSSEWPQCKETGDELVNILYEYGVIDRKISVVAVGNEKYRNLYFGES